MKWHQIKWFINNLPIGYFSNREVVAKINDREIKLSLVESGNEVYFKEALADYEKENPNFYFKYNRVNSYLVNSKIFRDEEHVVNTVKSILDTHRLISGVDLVIETIYSVIDVLRENGELENCDRYEFMDKVNQSIREYIKFTGGLL